MCLQYAKNPNEREFYVLITRSFIYKKIVYKKAVLKCSKSYESSALDF